MRAITAEDTDVITNEVRHEYTVDDAVVFKGLVPADAGLVSGTTYFVIASGLTARAFKVSATKGGGAVNITEAITAGYVRRFIVRGRGRKGR